MKLRNDKQDKRRREATERNARYEQLSIEDKIRSLAQRPGDSRKQISLLTGTNQTAKQALEYLPKVD